MESRAGSFTPVDGDNQFIDTFQSLFENPSGPFLGIVELWGGAISDVPSNATAFYPRDSPFKWWLGDFWYDGREADARIAKVEGDYESIIYLPGVSSDAYVNFLSATPENMQLAFGDNLSRLQKLKKKYDPHNFFSKGYVVK